MFGFFIRYSCSCVYLSVKKVLSCSFWSSDSFSSPPRRFNSSAMLLSSSKVTFLLFPAGFIWISNWSGKYTQNDPKQFSGGQRTIGYSLGTLPQPAKTYSLQRLRENWAALAFIDVTHGTGAAV